MGNFNRGGGFGGGGRGGRPSFGGGPRRSGGFGGGFDKEMHKATCSECGKSCEVPFRPTSGKPVYCSDCFKLNGGGAGREERFGGGRREFNDRPQRSSFGGSSTSNVGGDNNLSKKIEELSSKIDRLTEVVKSISSSKPVQDKTTLKEVVVSSLANKDGEVKDVNSKPKKKKASAKKTK